MYLLISPKSKLSLDFTSLFLSPVWTYGIQLWGTASISNINIIQRFQNKILGIIADAPHYVSKKIIQHNITLETVKEAIHRFSEKYSKRVLVHPNVLANRLNVPSGEVRRLKRLMPSDFTSGLRW